MISCKKEQENNWALKNVSTYYNKYISITLILSLYENLPCSQMKNIKKQPQASTQILIKCIKLKWETNQANHILDLSE